MIHRCYLKYCLLAFVHIAALTTCVTAADWSFTLQFSKKARTESFTGRVYLIFSKRIEEPRKGPSWFNPELFLSQEIRDWKPDTPLVISSKPAKNRLSHPVPLADMDLTGYRAQAVARFNPWEREIGIAPGNGYSQVITVEKEGQQPELLINSIVPPKEFKETHWTKLLKVRSELLSEFYGHDVYQHGAVILPASYYDEPTRRYPTIYTVPGFSGTHFQGIVDKPIEEDNPGGVEFIRIVLDPSCPLGHHVFADSANNGPRGRCLIEEVIPAFDSQFRSIAKPTARFVTGHSSGGWSSLWIQVTYPEHFGGTWSTAPDPVAFHDYQQVNLYESGSSMYADGSGKPLPLARINGQVRLWYRGFAEMEWTLGHGGQLYSFEGVFSPKGQDGLPRLMFDRKTGAVDTDVTKTWEKYDIRLILQRNWKQLKPKLRGKLHVIMGDGDTFYLEGATVLLKQTLKDLGSDAVVEIHEGKDHFNLMTPDLRNRIRREMTEAFLKYHKSK
jgi:hypothetical protein